MKESPFARPSFVLGAVFLAGVGVAGLYFVFASSSTDLGASSDSGSSMGHVVVSASGKCPPSSPTREEGGFPPGDVGTFEVREGVTTPSAPEIGPFDTEGLPRCFTRSPNGALFAAVTTVKQLFTQVDSVRVLETYVADTAVRQNLLATASTAQPVEHPQMLVLGYRLDSASENAVDVELALGAPWISDSPIRIQTQMVWDQDADDWRLVLSEDGWGMEILPVDLAAVGFTEWRV